MSFIRPPFVVCAVGFVLILLGTHAHAANSVTIRFEDVTDRLGLGELLERPANNARPWRYAHGAAWGDVDGDDRPDLFLGAFTRPHWFGDARSPSPNMLLLNGAQQFSLHRDETVRAKDQQARCAGALFVDLDNDGDLDLVVTNHVQGKRTAGGSSYGSRMYENASGSFRDVTPDSPPWNAGLGIRNAGAIDVNRDGLLDLVLTDGSYSQVKRDAARLLVLQNQGKFQFAEVTERLGLPTDKTPGLGLAVGDVNNDGWLDLLVADCNRLFVSDGQGKFRDATANVPRVTCADRHEGLHCGAAFGDLDNDGWLDLVSTEHGSPTRIHIFRNTGLKDGLPVFEERSDAAGLGTTFPAGTRAMPNKTAHVALRDADHDGRLDIWLSSMSRHADGSVQPVVLRNLTERGEIRFTPPPMEQLQGYCAAGPVADFDRDGRIDIFLPSWFEELPNRLLRNVTNGGRSLTVRVTGDGQSRNGMGIGAVIRAYEPGRAGNASALIGRADIVIGTGYASGEESLGHLGVGTRERCDLRIDFQGATRELKNVATDQRLVVAFAEERKKDARKEVEKAAAKSEPAKKEPAKKPVRKPAAPPLDFPPKLPGGVEKVTVTGPEFLQRPETLQPDVKVATAVPTVDFQYFPGQNYEGKPWSNWGEGSFANGKYYSAIGDHLAPQGNAFVYEYDPATKKLQTLTDLTSILKMPEGHYSPGKIHSRVMLGADGWAYYSTHRGSPSVTNDKYHYKGDWIMRVDPATKKSEPVVFAPVEKHCIPNGMIDPQRMIFYGGTAPGSTDGAKGTGIVFFAYDLKAKKLLYAGDNGPARCMIFSASTGRIYYTPGNTDSPLMRFDPASGKPPQEIPGEIGIRAATWETPDGLVYTASQGGEAQLYAFNTKTEKIEKLGPAAIGVNQYVASMCVEPKGRYVYYIPGAHGGSERDNSAVIQFDTKTRTRKVVAFLAPYFQKHLDCVPKGTYSVAINDAGDTLFATWNVARNTAKAWDCCGLTAIHIPASERP